MTFKSFTVPLSIIILFLVLPMLLALSKGVCCYDDASFAVLAKNLSKGMGYVMTLNYLSPDYSPEPFSPALGQGPVAIIPFAISIWIFGAEPVVPGLTQLTLELILLMAVAYYAQRAFPYFRTFAFLACSLLLITMISGNHFEHWYAMLGESMAALFLLCGFLAWCSSPPSPRTAVQTGLCMSLAFLTKEISAIFIFGFLVSVVIQDIQERRTHGRGIITMRILLCLALAGSLPFLAFEMWKLSTLGLDDYLANWRTHLHFIRSKTSTVSGADLYWSRVKMFSERFYLDMRWFFLIFMIAGVLGWRKLSSASPSLTLSLGIGIIFASLYWIFLSGGPVRYFYMGVVLWCFFICFSIMTNRNLLKGFIPFILAAVFIFPVGSQHFLNKAIGVYEEWSALNGFNPNQDEKKFLNYLDYTYAGTKIPTLWWPHVAALEYLSEKPERFQGNAFDLGYTGQPVLINWNLAVEFEFEKLQDHLRINECVQNFSSGPYRLFECTFPSAKPIEISLDPDAVTMKHHCPGNIDSVNGTASPVSLHMESDHRLNIRGWLAISPHDGIVPDQTIVILSNGEKKMMKIPAEHVFRPDLVSHYNNAKLANAGFVVRADMSHLTGTYVVNLAYMYEGEIKICPQFHVPITIESPT